MLTIDPTEVSVSQLHHYLLGAVAPRPIAFASTVDKEGNPNLSPFSFFNVFSANPPIMIFSPARNGRTGQTKNTLDNVKEVKEVVINIVNYSIVHQMSLSSSPFEKGINEFVKAGLTAIPSEEIKPFRVKESPVQFECKVNNLVICEVLKIHIDEGVLDETQQIDQHKIDLVSRMGGNWYCRADTNSMFEIKKPTTFLGIGFDQIPQKIRTSSILSGNDLGLLGGIEKLPSQEEIDQYQPTLSGEKHQVAKQLIEKGEVLNAWKVLLRK